MPKTWLVKTEPEEYSFQDLIADGETCWDGVRNHQARNNLDVMGVGDEVLVYHSGKVRAVVGRAVVVRAAYPDPTADELRWLAVDLAARGAVARPVTLQEIKALPEAERSDLVRQGRLSVVPLSKELHDRIVELAGEGA